MKVQSFADIQKPEAVIAVTTFQLPSVRVLLWCRWKAVRIAAATRERATGLIWIGTLCDFRSRQMVSISLWEDAASVASMGAVQKHIDAAHYAARKHLVTESAVYRFQGHWVEVVHGIRRPARRADQGLGE